MADRVKKINRKVKVPYGYEPYGYEKEDKELNASKIKQAKTFFTSDGNEFDDSYSARDHQNVLDLTAWIDKNLSTTCITSEIIAVFINKNFQELVAFYEDEIDLES